MHEEEPDSPDWRTIFAEIIVGAQAKRFFSSHIGVSPITLARWSSGESQPRLDNIRQLLPLLSREQRNAILPSLIKEYPNLANQSDESDPLEVRQAQIPSAFYESILDAYTSSPLSQRFWTISNLVLQQALGQLDPDGTGLNLTIVQCIPPAPDGQVRSLIEVEGRGTPPWERVFKKQILFLGIETLAGFAVTKGHSCVSQRYEKRDPAQWLDWEQSAMAVPITHHEVGIAGCLLVSSVLPEYFLSFRKRLIERYAKLLVLAFRPEDFYPINDINLAVMPSYEVQRSITASFQQRVRQVVLESMRSERILSVREAELQVMKELETQLTHL